ncbi:ComF family protein [Candidatus Peregrinibacteria bacterium]|nr:ComF family protein [Candidatus Peregrinibacteria bacterium]
MLGSLLDCLFPRRLPSERALLSCIDPIRLEGLALRKRGITALDRLVAAASYREAGIRQTVHAFKYSRMREYGQNLHICLLPCLPLLSNIPCPVLCPVPLHWMRWVFRGFNQSADLAAILAKEQEWQVRSLLRRVRPGLAQVGTPTSLRRRNVQGIFRCSVASPPYVLLVDDVATTGATLDACARALKDAGAKRVEGLVVALG